VLDAMGAGGPALTRSEGDDRRDSWICCMRWAGESA
jgi:hypothetical protein